MSIDLKLDDDLDWDIYAPKTQTEGKEKTIQQVLTTLNLQKNTWIYNTNLGILMREYILGQRHPDYVSFFSNLLDEINKIEGVKSSQVLDYSVDDNELKIDIEITFDDNTKKILTETLSV